MKVVLSGYYGFGNIGDESILEAMLRGLRSRDPAIDITVLSADPEMTSKTYNVKAVQRWKCKDIINAIRMSDVVISGGGGLLQDATGPLSLIYYLGVIFLAKFFKKKAAVIGQGFGPVRRFFNRLLVRWLLNKADIMILRDQDSMNAVSALGVNRPKKLLSADVTFILPAVDARKKSEILRSEGIEKDGNPLIGISIRRPGSRLSGAKSETYYRAAAAAVDEMIEKYGARPVFIPFHYPKDMIESAKVINLMRNPVHICVREYNGDDIRALIGSMDLFIGMRLHSLIFSAMESVPMAGISYDPKVKAFLSSIGQDALDVEDVSEDGLKQLFSSAWEKREAIKEKLKSALPEIKAKAELNFDGLFGYLKGDPHINILGVRIDNLTMKEALHEIDMFIRSRKPHLVVTPNPEMILAAGRDSDLKQLINEAHLNLPDGIGLIWAAKKLKKPLKERVSGIDLIPKVAELAEKNHYKIYLLGSAPGTAARAAEFLQKRYPNLKIAGTYHGFLTKEDEVRVIENIALTEPEILLVGMGSPKQEKWLSHKIAHLNVPVSIAVGGSMDVLAGKVKRAPTFMQRSGLEWFWRLLCQPWRIARQVRLLKFVWLIMTKRR